MRVSVKQAHAGNYKAASRTAADIGYLVIHYTGNRGDTAKNNADFFAREKVVPSRSAHYFVDENEVWQSVRDQDVAWQMSAQKYYSNARNVSSIGIEICMLDKAGNVRQGSIDNAARLVRELMTRYRVTVGRVLRHYDVTRKACPAPMVSDPKLWAAFKAALTAPEQIGEDEDMLTYEQFQQYMTRYEAERAGAPVSDYAQGAWEAMQAAGITDGTAPRAPLTREQYAVMQQRAALAGKR